MAALSLAVALPVRAQTPVPAVWDSVGRILQTTAAMSPGYVRYGLPRSDLHVTVGDLPVPVPLALGAWAGFSGTGDSALVMGDLVLTAAELAPVLEALDRERIDVTAVHNHLVGETPTVTYVHFHGVGAATELARRLEKVLRLTGTPFPIPPPSPSEPVIDTALVFSTLGVRGRANGPVAQMSPVLVRDTVRLHGIPLPAALAYASPVNIAQVTPGRFVATGDFALLAGQVGPVTHALATHGITTTALHSHLIGEITHAVLPALLGRWIAHRGPWRPPRRAGRGGECAGQVGHSERLDSRSSCFTRDGSRRISRPARPWLGGQVESRPAVRWARHCSTR